MNQHICIDGLLVLVVLNLLVLLIDSRYKIFWKLEIVMLCLFALQVTGVQTAVNCVQVARLVKTVPRDVTVRTEPNAPVRMDVVIAQRVSLCLFQALFR
jgi:hypothetical protein